MSELQREYFPARSCTGWPTRGAKALMAWWLGAYGGRGATNLGIYNCRVIDGSSSLSLHAEGRAADLGCPVGNDWSWAVAEFLRRNSKALRIQLIIHNKQVWSANQPDAGWRRYTGKNPHTDHLHVEITPDGADNLTVADINAAAGEVPPAPPATENPDWTDDLVESLPTVRAGHHDRDAVKMVQAIVNTFAAGDGAAELAEDGVFGPKTDQRVRGWQAHHSVPNSVRDNGTGDGAFGRACWTFALGRLK